MSEDGEFTKQLINFIKGKPHSLENHQSKDYDYIKGRVCAELVMRKVGGKCTIEDEVTKFVDKISVIPIGMRGEISNW